MYLFIIVGSDDRNIFPVLINQNCKIIKIIIHKLNIVDIINNSAQNIFTELRLLLFNVVTITNFNKEHIQYL
jgi:hypothetical protein